MTSPEGEAGGLRPGDPIGRFVVVRPLGAGGMGAVFEARDPELSRSVAIKVLVREGGDALRLLREAQALARISHPNVVAVHELGAHEGQVFIAMELVDGLTLDRLLGERSPGWREVLALFVAAGRGLAAVHAQGLVHRDVKPSNILVDRHGRVRIGDFGLARSDAADPGRAAPGAPATFEGSLADTVVARPAPAPERDAVTPDGDAFASPLTEAGAVVGTPRFMAPEQLAGGPVGRKADQFSFCVALWEALYGEHPFAAGQAVGPRRPVPPRHGVPAWLERALARGLAAGEAERWPSMDALLDEIERVPRHRRRRALVAAMLAAVGAASAAGVVLAHRGVSCGQASGALARVWSPSARAGVTSGLAATRLAWAPDVARRADAALGAWADRWRAARVDACRATYERGEESPAMLDRRSVCLERQLADLEALTAALAAADAGALTHALEAIGRLPGPEACSATRLLGAAPAIADPRAAAVDRALADARVALDLHAADLSARVERAVAAATELGAPGPRARALAIEAQAIAAREVDRSRVLIEQAQGDAAAAGDPVLEAELALEAVRLSFGESAADRIAALLPVARAAVARAGNLPPLARELANVESGASARLGHVPEARAACQRAVALAEPARAAATAVACACEVALAARDDRAAIDACPRRVADLRAELGDLHPRVADAQLNVVQALLRTGKLDQAAVAARELRSLYERLYGAGSMDGARTLRFLGIIEERQGKTAQALADVEQALAEYERAAPPDDPAHAGFLLEAALREVKAGKVAEAVAHADAGLEASMRFMSPDSPELANAYVLHGRVLRADPTQHEHALASFRRALAIAEAHPEQKLHLANVLAFYGSTLILFERPAEALPMVERAVPLYDAIGDAVSAGAAVTEIGECLQGMGRRADAIAAFERARDRFRALGAAGKGQLGEVEQQLATLHQGPRPRLP